MKRLRSLFTDEDGNFSLRSVLPFFLAGTGILAILVAVPPAWEYSNSTAFCGTTCHTMPPEYSTYQISPHSRVLCVDCHIGRDLLIVQAYRKTGHMRLLVDTLTGNYEYPIRAHDMVPARDSCEECHSPEKFSDDSLRTLHSFENNRTNDPITTYLLMHTGGGTEREGLGRGIHWHIENDVKFIATDKIQQEIPWVQVTNPDGTVEEFNAINSPIDTESLDQYEIHEMDCITCHNRIAHLIKSPEEAVDEALHRGDISREIPFIRARGVELLTEIYVSTEQAEESIGSLKQYYSEYYPEFYAQGAELIDQATDHLIMLYEEGNYPEQKLSWKTHPNNVGHSESPGCFRCHDGQHVNEEGDIIRLECNLCHSIPTVVRPGEIEPTIPLTTGLEPESHLDSTWIARHHLSFDATCANCHTTANPGGTTDQSFCSNSGCHGSGWEFAGFNAPGLASTLGIRQVIAEPLLLDFEGTPTYDVLQPLFIQQCGGCHGPVPSKGLSVIDYESLMEGSEDGAVIVPGSPEDSLIIQTLEAEHFAQLEDFQMEILRQWIAEGAVEQ